MGRQERVGQRQDAGGGAAAGAEAEMQAQREDEWSQKRAEQAEDAPQRARRRQTEPHAGRGEERQQRPVRGRSVPPESLSRQEVLGARREASALVHDRRGQERSADE